MSFLFYIDECSSTNDEITGFLNSENHHPVALYTFNQTKGRGQYGNDWNSSQNLNIAFSLACKEERIRTAFTLFNFYTAVTVRDFLARMTNFPVFVKWPNDFIIQNKKVGGMIIERKKVDDSFFFIVGIGLNVLQEKFDDLKNAGSILTQTGNCFDLHLFTAQFYKYISMKILEEISDDEIIENFNKNLYRKEKVSVFEKNGQRQNGIIKFADKDGFIWIDLENDGLQKFFNQEIKLLY